MYPGLSDQRALGGSGYGSAVLDAFVCGYIPREIVLSTFGLEGNTDALAAEIDFPATPRIAELA